MQHTRASLNKIIPKVGDGLYNNERVKMLTVTEDTSAGIHDTMIAACDKQRYEELGGGSEHRNCADNLVEGLAEIGECFLPRHHSASIRNEGDEQKKTEYR